MLNKTSTPGVLIRFCRIGNFSDLGESADIAKFHPSPASALKSHYKFIGINEERLLSDNTAVDAGELHLTSRISAGEDRQPYQASPNLSDIITALGSGVNLGLFRHQNQPAALIWPAERVLGRLSCCSNRAVGLRGFIMSNTSRTLRCQAKFVIVGPKSPSIKLF